MKSPIEYVVVSSAGLFTSISTATIPDYFIVDLMMAFFGAFIATSYNPHIHQKIWIFIIGLFMATAVSIILRSTEMIEWQIRGLVFCSGLGVVQILDWFKNPKEFLQIAQEALKTFGRWINK